MSFEDDFDGRGDTPQTGTATVTLTASSTGTASVTFSPAFSAAPKLSFSIGAVATYVVGWSSKTASGVTINLRRYDDANVTASIDVDWTARL